MAKKQAWPNVPNVRILIRGIRSVNDAPVRAHAAETNWAPRFSPSCVTDLSDLSISMVRLQGETVGSLGVPERVVDDSVEVSQTTPRELPEDGHEHDHGEPPPGIWSGEQASVIPPFVDRIDHDLLFELLPFKGDQWGRRVLVPI